MFENRKVYLIWAVILGCGILLSSACIQQKSAASATEKPVSNGVETVAANPEITAAEDFIKKAPEVAGGYNALALGYIKQARVSGDFSLNAKAEAAVKRALELEPENISAHKLRSSLLLTFHRFAEGREYATQMIQKFPRDAYFYGALTDANIELGKYDEALKAGQQMVDFKPDMTSYTRVGHLRSLYGDADGAIEAYRHAASIGDPHDKEGRAWCLTATGDEFFKIGKHNEAESEYDNALALLPEYNLALIGKGRVRSAANDLDAAVKFLTASINRVPNTEAIIWLGDVYTKQGNAEKAREQYALAEFIEAKLVEAGDQKRLALMWADQNVKLDEALKIAAAEHAARADIFTADAYAWCLYKKGDFAEAKKIIAKAQRLKTKDAKIMYHAALIERETGDKRAAQAMLDKALKLNPAFDLIQAENARKILADK